MYHRDNHKEGRGCLSRYKKCTLTHRAQYYINQNGGFSMKFFNNKVFLAALATISVGLMRAFPIEVTTLTNGEGKDKVTIFNFKDIHINGIFDQKNTQSILELAKNLDAPIILEKGLLGSSLDMSTEPTIIHHLLQASKINKTIKTTDPRLEIFKTFLHKNAQTEAELYKTIGNACIAINTQYQAFSSATLCNNDIKEAYKKSLSNTASAYFINIAIKHSQDETSAEKIGKKAFQEITNQKKNSLITSLQNPSDYMENISAIILSSMTFFYDLQILIEIDLSLSKGARNIILYAGANHGVKIDNLLTTNNFKETILSQQQQQRACNLIKATLNISDAKQDCLKSLLQSYIAEAEAKASKTILFGYTKLNMATIDKPTKERIIETNLQHLSNEKNLQLCMQKFTEKERLFTEAQQSDQDQRSWQEEELELQNLIA